MCRGGVGSGESRVLPYMWSCHTLHALSTTGLSRSINPHGVPNCAKLSYSCDTASLSSFLNFGGRGSYTMLSGLVCFTAAFPYFSF